MMRDRLLLGTPVAILAILAAFAAAFMLHQAPRPKVAVALAGPPNVAVTAPRALAADMSIHTESIAALFAQPAPAAATAGRPLNEDVSQIRQDLDRLTMQLQAVSANPVVLEDSGWRTSVSATAADLRLAGMRMQTLRYQPENASLDLLTQHIARHLQRGSDALDLLLRNGASSQLIDATAVEYGAARGVLDQVVLRLGEN